MTTTRRLSAVLAADVVGYSRMMQQDESGTLSALRGFRAELFEPTVSGHGGEVIKRMGDGWLVVFPAVVQAVRCAVDLQQALAGVAGQLRLRVGVHLGDVVTDEEDIYGDGVNVAARLQQAAEPGAVLVSDIVHRSVDEKMRALFHSAGTRAFKNMPEPVPVFKWGGQGTATVRVNGPAGARMIAVLPFANLSTDREQDFFADGITEEVITTLSKLPGLQVVARNSTFVYKGRSVDVKQVGAELGANLVLEGSVRTGGNRARITAQLIDATTATHLWADRYDRSLDNVFEVQDEIALRVATELQVELLEGEMARFHGAGTRDLEAWSEQMRAVACTRSMTREDCAAARRHATRAVQLDPGYAAAYGTMAFAQSVEARHGYTDSRPDTLAEARANARRSLELEPYNPDAWAVLGFADAIEGKLDTAIAQFRQALEQNHNHADVWARLSITLTFRGQTQEAISAAEQAIRLNPQYPGWYAGNLGFALRMAGRFDEAEARFREYSERAAGFGLMDLALIYVATGREADARRAAVELMRHRPGFRISKWAETQLFADKSLLDRDCESLRQLGLPE
ncbi:adenylate/guanylate cyclase domain-containing protein [Jhaorihella thermophila]|uniref:TolB amino-terminal domain-containing protein n=1 Tax=Jhaorihella thermophila TaxID=488547 RepID=A0A1H5TZ11_9RHOB|nr:adenylate/guanylate cyclase domain-containing protein [Jhaorihella thermophila]SEF68046.1 TolB amino-terminal domain-containing protein [Jhaorihella thermophila]